MRINTKKRIKRMLITLGILVFVFLTGILGMYFYVRHNIFAQTSDLEKIDSEYFNDIVYDFKDEGFPNQYISENKEENENQVAYEEQQGITNILLIGTDGRDLNERARSDAIIVVTIDDNTKKIKITSFLRDTYVSIPKYPQQKINAAYALGGPELLMDTIEKNFKLKLDKYIIVNFWGFEDIIDALGGVDIEIKDYEVAEINKYIGEIREKKSKPITKHGVQHLDGQQTLAYSRIRKVGNGVYERSQRQREVLSILTHKLKSIKILQYPSVMSKLFPCIKTNIEPISLLNYAYTISKFKPIEIKQLQMPMTELSDGRIYRGTWVFLMDKDQNSKILNDFIYKDKEPNLEEIDYKTYKRRINEYLRMGLFP